MVKITSLQIENVKRVKAVELEPSPSGLTVLGGRNGQGKTSVLDAIAWALGGDKFRPAQPDRDGSVVKPHIRVVLDNGLIVERAGKNSALKITDPSGRAAGQRLLDEIVGKFALDLPSFMAASSKDKAKTLLGIIGVGDQLDALVREERKLYDDRLLTGRLAEQKRSYADELTEYPGMPDEPVSAMDLIQRQQAILAHNGRNAQIRANAARLAEKRDALRQRLADLTAQLAVVETEWDASNAALALCTPDQSTDALERDIAGIEVINIKVRANLDKWRASEEATKLGAQYDALTAKIDEVRKRKLALLSGAELPLKGLSVNDDAELTYRGHTWDCMSGADQLRVATAIVRRINPDCGFVLVDRLEQMDIETLREFGDWLYAEGLQAIATRVSTGEECSIIITDGMVDGDVPAIKPKNKWKVGEF